LQLARKFWYQEVSDTLIHLHTRNRKRQTFSIFVKWLDLPQNADIHSYSFNKDRTEYINKALDSFEHNNSKGQFSAIMQEHNERIQAKEKFNGALVSEVTGLQGRELGEFMSGFMKQWATKDEAKAWALTTNAEDIKQAISAYHTRAGDIEI
jgi:ribosomal protein S11